MIDENRELAELLPEIQNADWLAMDTEAASLHTYPEKLCLLQLRLPGRDVILDPLADLDLGSLLEVLARRELIMHGADYDLRLLYRCFGFVPKAVFDTMLAARFLGYEKFGLSDLTKRFLDVDLEKGPQTANWSRRPLTQRMEIYARNDTRYLKPLADLLSSELRQKGRLEWHREACDRLITECTQPRPRDPNLVWRLPKSDRLPPPALAILRELWHWREGEALRTNKPPYFILPHETLISLATAAAQSSPLEPLIPPHLSVHRRRSIFQAISRGKAIPPSQYPENLRRTTHRSTAQERRRFRELLKIRDQRAQELNLDPSFVASRATLAAVARNGELEDSGLMRWQRWILR